MAVYTGPKYGVTDFDASRWRDLYSNLFSTGVIAGARVQGAAGGDLAASATSGLGWSVATGVAMIKGFACTVDTSAVTGTLAAADPTLPRIDTLVLSWAYSSGVGTLSVVAVTGTPASSPVAPTLTQNDTTFQLPLADCRVNAAATTIASVTDRRAYCSVVGNFLSSSGGTISGNLSVTGTLTSTGGRYIWTTALGGTNQPVLDINPSGGPKHWALFALTTGGLSLFDYTDTATPWQIDASGNQIITGNYSGPIGGGIPTTRNGAALSVPIYTGATTPSNPPTGSLWFNA